MSVSGQPAATYVRYVGSCTNTHYTTYIRLRTICVVDSVQQLHMTLHEIDACMSKFSPSNYPSRLKASLPIPEH